MSTNNISNIEKQVMGSVAVIYGVRQLVSPIAFACYAAFSFAALSFFVSVPHIAENLASSAARGGVPTVIGFMIAAVLGTQLVVQLGVLVAAVASTSFVVSATRSFTRATRSFA